MAVLLGAQDVARTPDLEVVHRDLEARAKLARLEDRLQPHPRLLGEAGLLVVEEVRVGLLGAATDAAAQLVELREAERARAVDDDRVHVRDVEAGFDDRRAHEDVVVLVGKVNHHPLEPAQEHAPQRS